MIWNYIDVWVNTPSGERLVSANFKGNRNDFEQSLDCPFFRLDDEVYYLESIFAKPSILYKPTGLFLIQFMISGLLLLTTNFFFLSVISTVLISVFLWFSYLQSEENVKEFNGI
jgi:hypothetical protein